jgi:predicted O-methyltransferase YrrM
MDRYERRGIEEINNLMRQNHEENYQFTNDWFATCRLTWLNLIPQINPTKILEIGSYEGASTCFLIETLGKTKPIELHCVDTWEGGVEHDGTDMESVESRFKQNTNIAIESATHEVELVVHKGCSDLELTKLIASDKRSYFDFIYVDGSHQAPDVICDAILSFKLLRVGGVIAFDDYLWAENLPYGTDLVRCPKLAIDAFTNIFCRKIEIIQAPLYQLYLKKTVA